jgi:hypothetical protein
MVSGSRPDAPAVSESCDHLTRGGQPWLYVADTMWSAFTHVPEGDWERYLEKRRRQGFSVLQDSVLPILHDLSGATALPEPFAGLWDGRPRLGALRADYVEAAKERLDAARRHGFVPALVDLWCNYAPNTWASRSRPEYVFAPGALEEYLSCVAEAFAPYEPIHIVSGDADFADPVSVDFYSGALSFMRQHAPISLTGMHLQPAAELPAAELPAPIADSPDLDLYLYQSGHHVELAHLTWSLAQSYRGRPVRRPVINIEPCYEGHGHGHRYGRFDRRDVRRAWWQSMLAGASAGFAYGAHGVWGWHAAGAPFNHADFSGVPFDRWDALEFPGADDVALTAHLARTLGIYGARPARHLAPGLPPEARLAEAPGGAIVAYLPWAIELTLTAAGPATVRRWNLERRDVEELELGGGPIVVPLARSLGDALLVIERQTDE